MAKTGVLSRHKICIFCLVLVLMAFVSDAKSTYATSNTDEVIPPKVRGPLFRTARELRRYLEQLDEWLAITGRPRFG
ncbi:unnamed protein product [Hymenolepis diminuta]|uniref:Uncharacterized protein n=1 Tax=Hymenolepis diminuta TaxID=6216 RepID=A0A564YJZ3_HYMDI|nr:unnamed protein product [Hymenolepis diminuta]